jgi:hypothetical protein
MIPARIKTAQPGAYARRPGAQAPQAAPQPGNLALQQSLRSGALQTKLTIGAPDDPAEAEADRMAHMVTSPCACGGTCATCTGGKKHTLRRQATSSAPSAGNIAVARSAAFGSNSGRPLSAGLRAYFEPRFGADFSGVRVHDNATVATTAREISANAFTAGSDIGFAAGKLAPDTETGNKLLAHELAHTLQNNAAVIRRDPAPQASGGMQPIASDTGPSMPNLPIYYYGSILITADQAYMRKVFLDMFAREGIVGADRWYQHFVETQGIPPKIVGLGGLATFSGTGMHARNPYDESRDMAERQLAAQILPVAKLVFEQVRREAIKFLDDFELRSRIVLAAMLDFSESKVQAEQQRYGLQTTGMQLVLYNPQMTKKFGPTDYFDAAYSMQDNAGKKSLAAAAKRLAAKLRILSKKWAEETSYMGSTATEDGPGELYVKDHAGHERWEHEFEEVEFAYLNERADVVGEFPILASFATTTTKGTAYLDKSAGQLEDIAKDSTPDLAKTLNQEANEKLANIYKTRWAIDQDELSVWKLESIVSGTKTTMNVKSGSMEERIVNDKVDQEKSKDTYFHLAVAAIALALGVLAAIPTGGSSLAAGIAVAAGVGSAALSVTIAYSDLKEYALKAAISGTDFEKAQAISQDDPSMFWLALSIIGAGLDLGAAVAAFKAFGPAARQLREAKRLAALGRLGAEESAAAKVAHAQLIEQAKQYPGLAEKIEAHLAQMAGEEAKNVERIATRWEEGLNAETKAFLETNSGLKVLYKDMDPVVRDILTHCASLCIIPNLTNRQYSNIKRIVYEHGGEELGGLKQYFHFRRNELDLAIKDLQQAKNLDEIKAVMQTVLQSSPVQAEEDAVLTWTRMQQSGATLESKADFIEKYRAGLRYDEGAHTWYNPVRGLKDTVPLGATSSEVLQTFKNSEGFAPFQKLLQDEQLIAGEDDLIRALENMRPPPRGRSVDAVRHALKDLYRDALVAKMVKPNELLMRLRYRGLHWENAAEAMRQASYQEMRRMTDGLASSDKGNLFERWYRATLSPSASEHVAVDLGTLKSLGSTYEKSRVIDLLEGDAIHELKRVAGALGEHDLGQFADNMLMVGKKLELGGVPVRRAIYSFPIPSGVQANAVWMQTQLSKFKGLLTFEVFNAAGERRIIGAAAEMSKPEFWKWLGLAKPP